MLGMLYAGWQIQTLLGQALKTEVQARVPLSEAVSGMERYVNQMTEGKILLLPEASPI
jgi:hypothetical protein